MHYCDDVTISTETRGDEQYHERITGLLRSSRSNREWQFTGEVIDLIPLRNRRAGQNTHIGEGMTEYTLDGERIGYGLSEYLDQGA